MRLAGPFNSGAAVGSAGVATANQTTTTIIEGKLFAVYVVYNDSPPATTDVTVATSGVRHPATTLLTLTNANTSTVKYPRIAVHDTAGVAVTYGVALPIYDVLVISDTVKVTIAQADAPDNVDVYLLLCD